MPNAVPDADPPGATAYPPGTVRALLDTDAVTPPTRAALRARLDDRGGRAPRFFGDFEFATLRAACAPLGPQPERARPVDVAACVDERLAGGAGDGWRYATMPPDHYAYPLGLWGLDECARDAFGASFVDLDAARQDAVLGAVQRGVVRGGAWDEVPAPTFFAELLAEVTACYYSHPLAQEEIGYAGMADAPGWQRIGLGELEPREPRAAEAAGA